MTMYIYQYMCAYVGVPALGTEPKLKYYLEVVAEDPGAASRLADTLEAGIRGELLLGAV